MNKFKLYALLGVLFCHVLIAKSQNTFQFEHYNYEDGLISNWINAIVQDNEGFIWIGTSNGLCRFDGYSFKNYEKILGDSTSLNDNFISDIAEDVNRNCLWLVTSSGISKFDKTTNRFQNYRISTISNDNYTPFARGSVCVDSKNNIWVEGFNEGYNQGLFKYIPEKDQFINISNNKIGVPKNLTAICEDKNQRLWFGTTKGLYYYIPKTESFIQISYTHENGEPLNITSLHVDSKNNLWIGTKQDYSLYLCAQDKISRYFKPDISSNEYNYISSITEYKDKNLMLAGVKDLGVLVINRTSGKSEILQPDLYNTKGIKSKNPRVIYADKFGNIWIGSYNNGINLIDNNKKPFHLYGFNYNESGLISNNVRAFFEDSEGDIWVGTKEGGGISRFYPDKGIFDNYKADISKKNWLTNDIIISINELEPGKLLIGTFGSGIFMYNKRGNFFSQFSTVNQNNNSISDNNVYAIYKDFDGEIWIGNNSNVDIYHPSTASYSHLNGVTYARCFLDLGKTVLIGTWSHGVYAYNKATKSVVNYSFKDPNLKIDNNTRFNGITRDKDGNIWFATNKGILQHDPLTSKNYLFEEKDGMADNYACAILVDDHNNIWTSTKGGISKLNDKRNKFSNYDKYDGLQSTVFEEFVSLKTQKGNMLFSGTNGFNIFHPDSIKDNLNVPNVLITEMRILNEPVKIGEKGSPLTKHISLTEELELTYEQSSFSFEFVGINYTSPEKNQYRYKMEGFDKEWKNANKLRTATYTHLPAGDYTFRVMASNNDGLWNAMGTSVSIKVLPPFWRSKIALVIYFLLMLLFLTIFKLVITYRTDQKNLLNEEIKEKKRLEELSRNRMRFFTNISHELRTPLTLIAAPLEKLTNYDTNDQQLKSLFQIMNRNAQHLLRLINQLMDFRRVEESRIKLKVAKRDIIQYSKEIVNSFKDTAISKQITLEIQTNHIDSKECWFDPGIIEKILFNLLSNAIKFTPREGKIEVNIEVENGEATIKVEDNGIGIHNDVIEKVFERFYTTEHADHNITGAGIGLAFTKSLLTLHHGTIKVESEIDKGSCFTFTIPVKKEAFAKNEFESLEAESPIITSPIIKEYSDNEKEVQPTAETEKEVIMIVEDHDDLREYLVSNFNNYKVIACNNGKDALKLAKEEMPDLILSDIMMPEMNGLELCNHIKTNFITSHIPVVLLTARTSAEQKMEGFQHHADAYIEKPFNIELLKIQVDNLLQLRKNIKEKFSNNDIIDSKEELKDQILPLDKAFMDKLSEIIESKITDSDLSVESLSADLGMSRSQLFRKFKALMDTTPSQYIRNSRLKKSAELLKIKQYNVNEVAYMVGFSDVSHFIAAFKKYFGKTPKQFADSFIK